MGMIYQFKCLNCEIYFEIEQPMHDQHKANCPKCGVPAQRIYTSPRWYWTNPKPLYHKDGSYEEKY